jgi:hypothetical protein
MERAGGESSARRWLQLIEPSTMSGQVASAESDPPAGLHESTDGASRMGAGEFRRVPPRVKAMSVSAIKPARVKMHGQSSERSV